MNIIDQSYRILILADPFSALNRIDTCGRIAYKSTAPTSPDSVSAFVKGRVKDNHLSVIEHSSMTVIFTTDRGVSHELVRHRLATFTQESTRYCNYSKGKFGSELTFIRPCWISWESIDEAKLTDWHSNWKDISCAQRWYRSCLLSEEAYMAGIEAGEKPQEARQVLNNSLKTEIAMTADFAEWRHVFQLRAVEKAAHPQMRALMIPLYEEMRACLPEIFDLGNPEE